MKLARIRLSSEEDYEVPYDGVHRLWMAAILSGLRDKAKCMRIIEKQALGLFVSLQKAQSVDIQLRELNWFFLEEQELPCNLAWICAHWSENGDGLKRLFRDEFNKNSYAMLERRFFRNAFAGMPLETTRKKACGEKVFTVNKQN